MWSAKTNRSVGTRSVGLKAALISGAMLSVGLLGGCNNAGEGLFSGAALGAVTGLALGSLSGNAGQGAAIGAIAGGAGGAILGDQNQRNRENAYIRGRTTTTRVVHQYPYCTTHRVYHDCRGHTHYRYQEWWHD